MLVRVVLLGFYGRAMRRVEKLADFSHINFSLSLSLSLVRKESDSWTRAETVEGHSERALLSKKSPRIMYGNVSFRAHRLKGKDKEVHAAARMQWKRTQRGQKGHSQKTHRVPNPPGRSCGFQAVCWSDGINAPACRLLLLMSCLDTCLEELRGPPGLQRTRSMSEVRVSVCCGL